jgi:hypothetical protein
MKNIVLKKDNIIKTMMSSMLELNFTLRIGVSKNFLVTLLYAVIRKQIFNFEFLIDNLKFNILNYSAFYVKSQ